MRIKNFLIVFAVAATMTFAFMFISKKGKGSGDKIVEKPMVIVIPSYNNKEWYQRNLDSVMTQNYDNYRVIYVDDASSDGTGKLVREYIRVNDAEHYVTLIENTNRVGALANLYKMISSCDKNEIIVTVDGDDWLINRDVLKYLNKVYSDPNVWMTYGQFIAYPSNSVGFASQVPQEVIEQNAFRSHGGSVTHLRTFYAGLFHKIKKEDLIYEGKFYPMAWDTAILVPMLEMSGKRSKYIPQALYVYNWSNPINDEKVDRGLQKRLDDQIRSKEKYQPIAEF